MQRTNTILVGVLIASLGFGGCVSRPTLAPDFAARTDNKTYKVAFPGPGGLESWFISLELQRPATNASLVALSATLLHEGAPTKTLTYSREVVEALLPDSQQGREEFYIDLLFHEPASLNTQQVLIEFEFQHPGSLHTGQKLIDVEVYEQKTPLIFPLAGKSLITAGAFNSGGHLSPVTQFAVDAVGVTKVFAPVIDAEKETNTAMAGWGRSIVAPAAGTVVFVQTGIPDQPYGTYDRESYRTADGQYAHWGNAAVIDHGNSEYGVIMHMQAGSVRVSSGDNVTQGQIIGALGNSGDSYGPHLHFHLQDQPIPMRGRGLPLSFTDVNVKYLRKGEWIDRE